MDVEVEEWRQCVGYDGYEVSNHRRVRSRLVSGPRRESRSNDPRILRTIPRSHRTWVALRVDGKTNFVEVERLVEQAFGQRDATGAVDEEEWRPIHGFNGYEASDKCRVRSWRHIKGWRKRPFVLRQSVDAKGYHHITLFDENSNRRRMAVHRAVLLAFVGPCPEGMEGCHNNGVNTDNTPDNLRWDTPQSNARDRVMHGTYARGEQHHNVKITETTAAVAVELIAHAWKPGEICDALGTTYHTVHDIARGRSWKHVDRNACGELSESAARAVSDYLLSRLPHPFCTPVTG